MGAIRCFHGEICGYGRQQSRFFQEYNMLLYVRIKILFKI